MKWTVIWIPDVEKELAALWINAPNRVAVTQAADAVDAQLRRDPFANSESRAGQARVMIEFPLAVAYDVSDDDRLIIVWAVWRVS